MSATATVSATAPTPRRAESPGRRLRAVDAPARRRRPRLLYGVVAVLGALVIVAAQMTLSILTTQTSYEIASLTQQQRTLTYQKQMLYDDVAGLSSPQYLAANATALGMVIDQSPNYLRLSDGKLLGKGMPSDPRSSVDAIGHRVVANALITDTPLVTEPKATIEGAPMDTTSTGAGGVAKTPPALTGGLPTPSTH